MERLKKWQMVRKPLLWLLCYLLVGTVFSFAWGLGGDLNIDGAEGRERLWKLEYLLILVQLMFWMLLVAAVIVALTLPDLFRKIRELKSGFFR